MSEKAVIISRSGRPTEPTRRIPSSHTLAWARNYIRPNVTKPGEADPTMRSSAKEKAPSHIGQLAVVERHAEVAPPDIAPSEPSLLELVNTGEATDTGSYPTSATEAA